MDPTDASALPAGIVLVPTGAESAAETSVDRQELVRTALADHEGPLLRYALSLLEGDLEQARDCVQDTFLRLCEQDPAPVAGHLNAWLFTVCRNRALDLHRKDRRMTPLTETDLETRPDSAPSPAEAAVHRESTVTALTFLQRLPLNQREVVRLKFQNQLSYQEIADITALSVTNVGFLLHTALKTLRRQMEEFERLSTLKSPHPTANLAN